MTGAMPPFGAQSLTRDTLRPRVGDLRQLASVRRIVLDDGPERGVRALAFSTGGGLDFWVLSDRSLDIGPLWWRGTPVAWQSPNGFRSPALHHSEAEGGRGVERSMSGFLVTCGLEHIRHPKDGHPLHGMLPFTPARVLEAGEDWEAGEPALYCEGEVTQARLNGERLRMLRRVEAPIGGNTLRIVDRVENIGAAAQAQAILYHCNIGFPFIDAGTSVWLGNACILGPLSGPTLDGTPGATCFKAGTGTATARLVTPSTAGEKTLTMSFDASTLPYLQVWSHPHPFTHVVGIEPCTSDRMPDNTSGPEPMLAPGESRTYRLMIAFS
jgi:hypothetical protein